MRQNVKCNLHDGFTADGIAQSISTKAFYRRCHNVLGHGGVLVSNLWGDTGDMVFMINRLHAVSDGKLWWSNASGSFNRIVFSGNTIDQANFHSGLLERAAQLDLHHEFSFCDLVDQ